MYEDWLEKYKNFEPFPKNETLERERVLQRISEELEHSAEFIQQRYEDATWKQILEENHLHEGVDLQFYKRAHDMLNMSREEDNELPNS